MCFIAVYAIYFVMRYSVGLVLEPVNKHKETATVVVAIAKYRFRVDSRVLKPRASLLGDLEQQYGNNAFV